MEEGRHHWYRISESGRVFMGGASLVSLKSLYVEWLTTILHIVAVATSFLFINHLFPPAYSARWTIQVVVIWPWSIQSHHQKAFGLCKHNALTVTPTKPNHWHHYKNTRYTAVHLEESHQIFWAGLKFCIRIPNYKGLYLQEALETHCIWGPSSASIWKWWSIL